MRITPKATNLLVFMLLASSLVFIGCQKESNDVSQQDNEQFAQATSESDAEAEATFDDVFDNVIGVNTEVGIGGTGLFGQSYQRPGEELISGANGTDSVPACLTITVTHLNPPAVFPVKIVLDFGSGCTGRDGRVRKGKIITVYTGRLIAPGSVAETTFDGYYVNGIHVEGTHRVQNKSTSNNLIFEIKVTNAKLTKPNGNYSQWNSVKLITQIEGNGTPLHPLDDIFSIKGETNGAVKRDSVFYQWAARTLPDNPLIKKWTCRWIVKGKVAMRRSNSDVAILDYGTGNCDNKATITVNGAVYEITLH